MRTHGKRLLDHLPTPIAFLRGVAGVHSNDLMSGTFSLGSENIKERAPGGVHDALCEMVVFHHPINVQVLDGDMLILVSILFGDLEMKVPPLPFDLQMRLSRTLGRFPTSLRAFLSTCNRALLPSQSGLALAIVTGVLNRVSFAIRQKGLQPNVDTDIRMRACRWAMLSLWLRLTDNENIPMPIGTQNEMGCLWGAFDGTV